LHGACRALLGRSCVRGSSGKARSRRFGDVHDLSLCRQVPIDEAHHAVRRGMKQIQAKVGQFHKRCIAL